MPDVACLLDPAVRLQRCAPVVILDSESVDTAIRKCAPNTRLTMIAPTGALVYCGVISFLFFSTLVAMAGHRIGGSSASTFILYVVNPVWTSRGKKLWDQASAGTVTLRCDAQIIYSPPIYSNFFFRAISSQFSHNWLHSLFFSLLSRVWIAKVFYSFLLTNSHLEAGATILSP